MPSYFLEVHALNLRSSAGLAFIPWLVMAIGSSLSGLFADRWLAKGASVAIVRKTFQAIAFAVRPGAAGTLRALKLLGSGGDVRRVLYS